MRYLPSVAGARLAGIDVGRRRRGRTGAEHPAVEDVFDEDRNEGLDPRDAELVGGLLAPA